MGRATSRMASLCLTLMLASLPAFAQGAFTGTWTVAAATPGPWAKGPVTANPMLRSARIVFRPDRLDGPGFIACRSPRYELMRVPAEGLFEGGLHVPAAGLTDAKAAATRLGFPPGDAPTVEVRCHEVRFHMATPDQVLFALDNMIYTLHRTDKR